MFSIVRFGEPARQYSVISISSDAGGKPVSSSACSTSSTKPFLEMCLADALTERISSGCLSAVSLNSSRAYLST